MKLKLAQRSESRMRIALCGPSGSGKTYSALEHAFGLTRNKNIAVVDTESGSASLYSHLGEYWTINLAAPYTPERYMEAMQACIDHGADVIILDSLSHEWDGSGGILESHGSMPGNSFANWSTFTPRHNRLVEFIHQLPVHCIATIRTKQDYVLNQQNGTSIPQKVGLKPIQRDGIDYEFTVVFDLDHTHVARTSKGRTGLFHQKVERVGRNTGRAMLEWCEGSHPETPADVMFELSKTYVSNGSPF